jgi:hypothetical protein
LPRSHRLAELVVKVAVRGRRTEIGQGLLPPLRPQLAQTEAEQTGQQGDAEHACRAHPRCQGGSIARNCGIAGHGLQTGCARRSFRR